MKQQESPSTTSDRHIWQMDCVAISTVLAHGLTIGELRSLVKEHSCSDCASALDDVAWVLQVAHQACHKENAFSRRIEAILNQRYRDEVAAVRGGATCLEVVRRVSRETLSKRDAIAAQWALLSDPDHEKQQVGHHLAHALLLKGAAQQPPAFQPYRVAGAGAFTEAAPLAHNN